MDPTLIKWMTINFPSEVVTPILLFLMFLLSLWPKIWNIILNQREWNKVIFWERQRLELMKLRYDIEAIKKDKELEDIEDYPASPEFENLLHTKIIKSFQREMPTVSTLVTNIMRVSSVILILGIFHLIWKYIIA